MDESGAEAKVCSEPQIMDGAVGGQGAGEPNLPLKGSFVIQEPSKAESLGPKVIEMIKKNETQISESQLENQKKIPASGPANRPSPVGQNVGNVKEKIRAFANEGKSSRPLISPRPSRTSLLRLARANSTTSLSDERTAAAKASKQMYAPPRREVSCLAERAAKVAGGGRQPVRLEKTPSKPLVKVSSKTKVESKVDSKVESKIEKKIESKTESKPESKTNSKTESKTESRTESLKVEPTTIPKAAASSAPVRSPIAVKLPSPNQRVPIISHLPAKFNSSLLEKMSKRIFASESAPPSDEALKTEDSKQGTQSSYQKPTDKAMTDDALASALREKTQLFSPKSKASEGTTNSIANKMAHSAESVPVSSKCSNDLDLSTNDVFHSVENLSQKTISLAGTQIQPSEHSVILNELQRRTSSLSQVWHDPPSYLKSPTSDDKLPLFTPPHAAKQAEKLKGSAEKPSGDTVKSPLPAKSPEKPSSLTSAVVPPLKLSQAKEPAKVGTQKPVWPPNAKAAPDDEGVTNRSEVSTLSTQRTVVRKVPSKPPSKPSVTSTLASKFSKTATPAPPANPPAAKKPPPKEPVVRKAPSAPIKSTVRPAVKASPGQTGLSARGSKPLANKQNIAKEPSNMSNLSTVTPRPAGPIKSSVSNSPSPPNKLAEPKEKEMPVTRSQELQSLKQLEALEKQVQIIQSEFVRKYEFLRVSCGPKLKNSYKMLALVKGEQFKLLINKDELIKLPELAGGNFIDLKEAIKQQLAHIFNGYTSKLVALSIVAASVSYECRQNNAKSALDELKTLTWQDLDKTWLMFTKADSVGQVSLANQQKELELASKLEIVEQQALKDKEDYLEQILSFQEAHESLMIEVAQMKNNLTEVEQQRDHELQEKLAALAQYEELREELALKTELLAKKEREIETYNQAEIQYTEEIRELTIEICNLQHKLGKAMQDLEELGEKLTSEEISNMEMLNLKKEQGIAEAKITELTQEIFRLRTEDLEHMKNAYNEVNQKLKEMAQGCKEKDDYIEEMRLSMCLELKTREHLEEILERKDEELNTRMNSIKDLQQTEEKLRRQCQDLRNELQQFREEKSRIGNVKDQTYLINSLQECNERHQMNRVRNEEKIACLEAEKRHLKDTMSLYTNDSDDGLSMSADEKEDCTKKTKPDVHEKQNKADKEKEEEKDEAAEEQEEESEASEIYENVDQPKDANAVNIEDDVSPCEGSPEESSLPDELDGCDSPSYPDRAISTTSEISTTSDKQSQSCEPGEDDDSSEEFIDRNLLRQRRRRNNTIRVRKYDR